MGGPVVLLAEQHVSMISQKKKFTSM